MINAGIMVITNAMMGQFKNIQMPPTIESNNSMTPAIRAMDLPAASWFTLTELKRKQVAPIKLTMMHVQTKICIIYFIGAISSYYTKTLNFFSISTFLINER
jgi:hypothetical protein